MDAQNAGNHATNVVVHYTVVYGLGGFLTPLPFETLKQPGSTIAVKFRLTNAAGTPISGTLAAALAAAGKVKVFSPDPVGSARRCSAAGATTSSAATSRPPRAS